MDGSAAQAISENWEAYRGMPTAAETGVSAGDVLVGVCECNRGMVIQVEDDVAPCFDPSWRCECSFEDALDLHNFVVVPSFS